MAQYHFNVLVLDQAGMPKKWVSKKEAILYHAVGKVGWCLGDDCNIVFRGGINNLGEQSVLTSAPIISITGDNSGTDLMTRTPLLINQNLFRRDCFRCAYCGQLYSSGDLSCDHIIPKSRGGKDVWSNVITACKGCNRYKGSKLLHEIDLEMRYNPYVPSHPEVLIYENHHITASQVSYLLPLIKNGSRVKEYLQGLAKHLNKNFDGGYDV